MKRSPRTEAFLTRFEASVYLQVIYRRYLKANKLEDTERPDWYSILVENARDPLSLSALKKGCPRGNRGAYTRVDFIRIMGRPHYTKANLDTWFMLHCESKILDRAAA